MKETEEPLMVYTRWQNEGDFDPLSRTSDGERYRVAAWHRTYNAALTGLIQLKVLAAIRQSETPGVRPMELAQGYADDSHGPIPRMEKRIWASGSYEVRMVIHTPAIP